MLPCLGAALADNRQRTIVDAGVAQMIADGAAGGTAREVDLKVERSLDEAVLHKEAVVEGALQNVVAVGHQSSVVVDSLRSSAVGDNHLEAVHHNNRD